MEQVLVCLAFMSMLAIFYMVYNHHNTLTQVFPPPRQKRKLQTSSPPLVKKRKLSHTQAIYQPLGSLVPCEVIPQHKVIRIQGKRDQQVTADSSQILESTPNHKKARKTSLGNSINVNKLKSIQASDYNRYQQQKLRFYQRIKSQPQKEPYQTMSPILSQEMKESEIYKGKTGTFQQKYQGVSLTGEQQINKEIKVSIEKKEDSDLNKPKQSLLNIGGNTQNLGAGFQLGNITAAANSSQGIQTKKPQIFGLLSPIITLETPKESSQNPTSTPVFPNHQKPKISTSFQQSTQPTLFHQQQKKLPQQSSFSEKPQTQSSLFPSLGASKPLQLISIQTQASQREVPKQSLFPTQDQSTIFQQNIPKINPIQTSAQISSQQTQQKAVNSLFQKQEKTPNLFGSSSTISTIGSNSTQSSLFPVSNSSTGNIFPSLGTQNSQSTTSSSSISNQGKTEFSLFNSSTSQFKPVTSSDTKSSTLFQQSSTPLFSGNAVIESKGNNSNTVGSTGFTPPGFSVSGSSAMSNPISGFLNQNSNQTSQKSLFSSLPQHK